MDSEMTANEFTNVKDVKSIFFVYQRRIYIDLFTHFLPEYQSADGRGKAGEKPNFDSKF